MQHDSNGSAVRKLVVRQDRHVFEDFRAYILCDNLRLEVLNYSTFGIACIAEKEFAPFSIQKNLKIELFDKVVHEFDAKVVRATRESKGYVVAFEVLNRPIPVEVLKGLVESHHVASNIIADHMHNQTLPDSFRLKVYEIKDFLSALRHQVEQLAAKPEYLSRNEQEAFEESVIDAVARPLFEMVRDYNLKLRNSLEGVTNEVRERAFRFYRHQLRDLVYQSPFAKRSLEKPLGYAGDYQMMGLIYRNESMGSNLFARCIEKALQMHQEPSAVRNRVNYLSDKIKKIVEEKGPRTKIFSVACGPAFELIKYIQGNDKKYWQDLQITLLDQDVLALKEAQRNILSAAKLAGGHVNVKLMNTNIKDLILRGTEESDFDLIYSSGLFDYFTDPVAKRAGAMLFDKLAPRGLLIIGNFSSSSPNYFGMQVVFDWHLVLRSEQDLLRLFAFENAEVKVEAEAENVNLFCNVRRAN